MKLRFSLMTTGKEPNEHHKRRIVHLIAMELEKNFDKYIVTEKMPDIISNGLQIITGHIDIREVE
jgi:hypothetical protein